MLSILLPFENVVCCLLFVRVKFRARLRALLALSALAPPTLVAEVIAGDKDKDGWEAATQGGGLSSLSDLRRCVRDQIYFVYIYLYSFLTVYSLCSVI